MAKVDFSGEVVKVLPAQNKNGFEWQEIIVDDSTNSDYPNPLPIQVGAKLFNQVANIKAGDSVSLSCWVDGSYWQTGDRYFVKLKLASIEASGGTAHPSIAAAAAKVDESEGELPF